ncbi:TB2/DP1, HVA22 family-domain-containing protein [Truncatella angustata]|uniref:Protein YOP1 n=1 Tax=Truncatella angustata TaxID=152316 RepID=A0A9P8UJC9_9PEZI|nr:TB2/DP1, HVA22 family-domain-containing protein [Truncatella angustata]KAH6653513.1 TB2/DP1, HVA22 family-domain-containing protein [Truncatella angustata]
MLSSILDILNSTLCLLYPLLATFKALKTPNIEKLREWLMYWSILSTVMFIESLSHSVLELIPVYALTRLVFILYLLLPNARGHRRLFESFLRPLLDSQEKPIESMLRFADDGIQTVGSFCLQQVWKLLATQWRN